MELKLREMIEYANLGWRHIDRQKAMNLGYNQVKLAKLCGSKLRTFQNKCVGKSPFTYEEFKILFKLGVWVDHEITVTLRSTQLCRPCKLQEKVHFS